MHTETRPTVRVDDALLGFCNEAYERATRRGASEVGIADLAWCIAGSARWTRDIELAGASVARLRAAADATMATDERGGKSRGTGAPRTADELKTLLARAESIADRLGRACATTGDFIHVLLLEADDLGSAAFVRSSVGQPSTEASERRTADRCVPADPRAGGWSRAERATSRGDVLPKWRRSVSPDVRPSVSAAADMAWTQRGLEPRETARDARHDPHARTATTGLGSDAVEERLATYETHLAALRRQIGGLTEQLALLTGRIERLAERNPAEAVRHIGAELRTHDIANGRETAGLASRLDALERHLTELRRQIAALSHESETLAARLAQALDLGRTQATALARMEQFAGSTVAPKAVGGPSRGRSARAIRKAARSRMRQIRRRNLRFRLRQRRRDRSRLRLRAGGRRLAWSRRAMPVPAATSRATPGDDRDLAPVRAPAALVNSMPRMSTAEPIGELDEDDAEPIEDEDDLEPVGAFGERPKRFYLSLGDDVERAPSIGPRTAERLTAAGIVTVRDLLMCEPRDIASRIASRYVSVDRVTAWKAQARLVCTIPWLRGTHAQLLVGAGFDSLESLVDADTSSVCAGILRFAATREGQSVLRSSPPPATERVAKWMEHVTLAEPERAKLAA